jgi:dihydroorotate dehydrogenase electron transfer subunit
MKCHVASNAELAPGFFHLTLVPESPLGPIAPGQFVMIRCSDGMDPLLRRPMSVAQAVAGGARFSLIVQWIGRGTQALASLVENDHLDVIGPFGTGFTTTPEQREIMIVAGGTGVAPFIGLAAALRAEGRNVVALLGARSAGLILMESQLRAAGAEVHLATEDGSKGFDGLATGLMEKTLDGMENPPDAVLTCGPEGMMRAVARIAEHNNIPCQVSLETKMACGFGACLGCVTPRRGEEKYITVCRKGPVFDSRQVEI